jgi:hypothetical protein
VSNPRYIKAAARLRDLALLDEAYERPLSRSSGRYSATGGKPLANPIVSERLVPVASDKAEHVRVAMDTPFPAKPIGADMAPSLAAAIEMAVSQGPHLPQWRANRCAEIAEIAESISDIAEWLVSISAEATRHLLDGTNLALMAAFIDGVNGAVDGEAPDVELVRRYVGGFPIVGDIPDSRIHRPHHAPASLSMRDVTDGVSNVEWTDQVVRSVTVAARSATGTTARVLREVAQKTMKEACKGHVIGPRTRSQLNTKWGVGNWRPQIRFGVEQGSGVRAIDNAKSALFVASTTTVETVVLITVEFSAGVAAYVAICCDQLGIPMFALLLGLDDLPAAYRFVPNAQPWFTVVCIFCFTKKSPVFYWVPGHTFGMASSVINFCRLPALVCHMGRVLLAVPCAAYVDDFKVVDLAVAGNSGQDSLAFLASAIGRPFEPTKRKRMAPENVGLGVHVNLRFAHLPGGVVILQCTEQRIANLLAILQHAREGDFLAPGTAATCRGKAGFLFTTAYGKVGRACMQPLAQREFYDTNFSFTPTLRHMLEFLETLLPVLPSLWVPVRARTDAPILVYTDAMFIEKDGLPYSRVSYSVFDPGAIDPTTGCAKVPETLVQDWLLPPAVFALLSLDLKTYIMQAEVIAIPWVYYSMPERFRGRRVIHFIDNTGALSAVIHGYARKLDCARMVNSLHLLLSALRVDVWFEWVPSAANNSDLPSRADEIGAYELFYRLFPSAVQGPSVLPPIATWSEALGPLSEVFAMLRERAEAEPGRHKRPRRNR